MRFELTRENNIGTGEQYGSETWLWGGPQSHSTHCPTIARVCVTWGGTEEGFEFSYEYMEVAGTTFRQTPSDHVSHV